MEVTGQLHVLLLHFQREPWYTFNRRLGGFRTGVDILEKRKITCPCWSVNFGSSIVTVVIILAKLYLLPFLDMGRSNSNMYNLSYMKVCRTETVSRCMSMYNCWCYLPLLLLYTCSKMCLNQASSNQMWRLIVQRQRSTDSMVPLFIQVVKESLLVLRICYFVIVFLRTLILLKESLCMQVSVVECIQLWSGIVFI